MAQQNPSPTKEKTSGNAESNIDNNTSAQVLNFILGFRGRIGRKTFLLKGAFPALLLWIFLSYFLNSFQANSPTQSYLSIFSKIVFLWFVLAVGTKRLHDLNRSTWQMIAIPPLSTVVVDFLAAILLYTLPGGGALAGALFGFTGYIMGAWFIGVGCFVKGDEHKNKYGENPIAGKTLLSEKTEKYLGFSTLAIPFLYLLFFTVQHNVLNNRAEALLKDPQGKTIIMANNFNSMANEWIEKGQIINITQSDFDVLSGSWPWRFIEWGAMSGYITDQWIITMQDKGISGKAAHALNPINPTPFAIFIISWVIPLAVLGHHGKKKLKY